VRAAGETRELPLSLSSLDDRGDLRRRWAEARLGELLVTDAGRAAMVDVGMRYGIITAGHLVLRADPARARGGAPSDRSKRKRRSRPTTRRAAPARAPRAKRARWATRRASRPTSRYGVQGPADNADPHAARQQALRESAEFGMIGLLNSGAGGDPSAPTAPWGRDDAKPVDQPQAEMEKRAVGRRPGSLGHRGPSRSRTATDATTAKGNMWATRSATRRRAGVSASPRSARAAAARAKHRSRKDRRGRARRGNGTGQGFARATAASAARTGARPEREDGRDERQRKAAARGHPAHRAPELGRFRLCYEQGLANNPNLEGRVSVRFMIDAAGSVGQVANGGSDLPDSSVVSCVVSSFQALSFPAPEGGR